MTHKQRVLDLLSDGLPHSHMDGYRLGVMLHSRVADLRREGHNIACWREGDVYMYRLLTESGAPDAAPDSVSGRPTIPPQLGAVQGSAAQLDLLGSTRRGAYR